MWSSSRTHEPLVTREIFLAAQQVAKVRERSRSGSSPNAAHPNTRRTYPLRSFVFCSICGRRMYGKVRNGYAYMFCQPRAEYRPAGHPRTHWVREKYLLDGVLDFFARRIIGPDWRAHLAAALDRLDKRTAKDQRSRLAAARRAVADVDARRARLVRTLEFAEIPDDELIRHIRARATSLAAEHSSKLTELKQLERADLASPRPELLDALPFAAVDLAMALEPILRHLFEAFRLEVCYDRRLNTATCRVTVAAESIARLRQAAERVLQHPPDGAGSHVPICVVPPEGLEPPTRGLGIRRQVYSRELRDPSLELQPSSGTNL
ncbi:MAG TPA: zinc ribbon domain-containing protein [Candidatus Dormibacteraeota bacterium]|nr:zinc ribbon domain-containing protein [Candidatus Dormibacteraeota bacterium]